MERKTRFVSTFRTLTILCVLSVIVRGGLFFLNNQNKKELKTIQAEKSKISKDIKIRKEKALYQKIAFAEKLEMEGKSLPRSEHIKKLIKALDGIQKINEEERIELYDFKVNLDNIEISGKASRLAQLYAPKEVKNPGLITTISELSFLKDIRIQHYEKTDEENMYTFILYANIILNENK